MHQIGKALLRILSFACNKAATVIAGNQNWALGILLIFCAKSMVLKARDSYSMKFADTMLMLFKS